MSMSQPLHNVAYGNLLQIAESLETARLVPPFTSFSVSRHVPTEQCDQVADELTRLYESGMQISHLVYVLRVIADEKLAFQTSDRVIELVWTGPEVPGAESRDTGVLVEELFTTADKSVLIAGFAVAQGKRIFKTLSDRMRELPALQVRMFLNVPRPYRDSTPEAELLVRFADRFRLEEWPGPRVPEVFYDRRALALGNCERVSLHAKCIVVDERKTLVTSANFTEAAQMRNIEAGVYFEDSTLARSLIGQFEALISNGILCRLPGLQ
jgi:phosphatidylserine/phosphatidylglycerophosphate/cardiolipin synthase-like enzyme